MPQTIWQAFMIMVKFIAFGGSIVMLTNVLLLMNDVLSRGLDNTVLLDLMTIAQIWLPFDISVFFNWFIVIAILYLSFKYVLFGLNWFNKIIGQHRA